MELKKRDSEKGEVKVVGPRRKIAFCTPKHRIGLHVKLRKTLFDTITQPDVSGCHAIQFFIGSNRVFARRKFDPLDMAKCYKYCLEKGLSIYSHASYKVNSSAKFIEDDENFESLKFEVEQMVMAGGQTVVHIGKGGATTEDVAEIFNRLELRKIPDERRGFRYPLLLENAAGAGKELGTALKDIVRIYDLAPDSDLGMCLDTQHLFAAGQCKFDTVEAVDKLFESIEETVGLKRLQLVHLNDSKVNFNSRRDRHWPLLEGFIWGFEEPPFAGDDTGCDSGCEGQEEKDYQNGKSEEQKLEEVSNGVAGAKRIGDVSPILGGESISHDDQEKLREKKRREHIRKARYAPLSEELAGELGVEVKELERVRKDADEKESALTHFIQRCMKLNIDMVVETPSCCDNVKDAMTAISLCGKKKRKGA